MSQSAPSESRPPLSPPKQSAQWMYAHGDAWATFQPHDNEKLERRWTELGGEGWGWGLKGKGKGGGGGMNDDTGKSNPEPNQVNHILDPDEPASERTTKVEVMEDNLFDVDLETMRLYPVFWKGVVLKVVRATWFYSSLTDGTYAPISWEDALSHDLDEAYSNARPWMDGGNSAKHGEEGGEEGFYSLASMGGLGRVGFVDAEVGRIFSRDLRGRFLTVVGGGIVVRGFDRAEQIAREKSISPLFNIPFPWGNDGGTDGSDGRKGCSEYTESQRNGTSVGAKSASNREGAANICSPPACGGGSDGPNRTNASIGGDRDERRSFAAKLVPSSDVVLRPLIALKKMFGYEEDEAVEEEKRRVEQEMMKEELDRQRRSEEEVDLLPDDRKDEPPELVFAIHGIGQQLTEDFEALDFVYDVEHLRNLATENSRDPALRRLSRGRRAQILPICWRRFMQFDHQPETNDNFYTLDDITNSAAIPMVRNVITKVVLDVPFYLSRHRAKMIESVVSELNRTYRLFCRRNPEFELRGGRVSLIGHSLGSALAADILSAQPSRVAPLFEMEQNHPDALRRNDHLHFNVKNLFFIGSPVAFFFHLDGGQLIARSGTQRHAHHDSDALDGETGRYGCLAAENVYNIFNPNDPVAFQLGPTVDAAYSRLMRPISIESATEALLYSLALPRISVSAVFEKYKAHPFGGVGRIVRQATILEGGEEALPEQLSLDERDQVRERQAGRRIVAESDYIQTIRRWHQLQTDRTDARHETSETSETCTASQPALSTEKGSVKKTLQPTTVFGDSADAKHDLDLDKLERAERRFRALNPHGCIDYHLSAGIGLSGYLDMFGAHVAYWTHRDFAMFVLTQLFMDFTSEEGVTIVPQIQTS